MIEFKISFLLAFLNNPQYEGSKASKRGTSEAEKSTATKASKKKNVVKPPSKNKSESENAANVIDTGHLLGTAHIDIMLLPNLPSESIDIVCYENVAKIFAHPDSKAIKVLARENIVWVPVHLSLFYDHFKNLDSLLLVAYDFVANCHLSLNKSKLSNEAKNNKIKEYHYDDCISNFAEVFSVDLETAKANFDKPNKLGRSNYDKTHLKFVDKIINSEKDMWFNHFISFPDPPLTPEDEILSDEEYQEMLQKYDSLEFRPYSDKLKGKKSSEKSKKIPKTINKTKQETSKKSKDSKVNKNKTEIAFQISGESYFTNPNICIYKIEPIIGSSLQKLFTMVSVENLLTPYQKKCLKPLVINVKKIMNLPYDFLLKNRFESIYLRYSSKQFEYSSSTVPRLIKDHLGSTDMQIREAHVCFIKNLDICQVQEFFQTRKLKIEVVGIRDKALLKTNPASLFGSEIQDKNISNISTFADYFKFLKYPKEPREEVIAVCALDLNFSTEFLHEITTVYCHHPENRLIKTYENAYRVSPFNWPANKNEINLNYKMLRTNTTNPVSEALMLESDTCIRIEWFLMRELNLLGSILATYNMYRRGIFIVKDQSIAVTVLRQIMLQNQEVLTTSVILPNYFHTLTRDYLKPSGANFLTPYIKAEVITGFVIDNFDTFIFFLETRSSLLMMLFEDLCQYTELACHLLVDSNLVFEKRLYNEFLNYGGYYVVTMQRKLQVILSDENVYIKGNIPLPCFEALMKLDLLLKSGRLSNIYKDNLLPTSKELLSLQMEFGAAHRWSDYFADAQN